MGNNDHRNDIVRVLPQKTYIRELAAAVDRIIRVVESGPYLITAAPDESFQSDLILNAMTAMAMPSGIQSSIRDVIVESCRASAASGGNAAVTARLSLSLLAAIMRAHKVTPELISNIDRSLSKIKNHILSVMCHPSEIEQRALIERVTRDSALASAVIEAFSMAGLEGRIVLDRHTGPDLTVELTHGSRFDVDVPTQFLGSLMRWSACAARCMVVDGQVERVSEIHGILDAASRAREPMVMFCTNYAHEVYSTLHTNLMRGTLNVIPIRIPDDIDSVNKLADISIVCGTDLVSSLKGQLISTIMYDSLPTVGSVICTPGSVTIVNESTSQAQSLQIAQLENRIAETDVADMRELYEKRIRALVSICATISAPAGAKHDVDRTLESLEAGIMAYRTIIARGCVEWGRILDVGDDLHPLIRQAIVSMPDESTTTNAALSAFEYGITNALLLAGSGAALELDR